VVAGGGFAARRCVTPLPPPRSHARTHAPSPFPPRADSLALVGLNCYHLVKAGKGRKEDGTDIPFFSLLKAAVTDRVALFMAISMVFLAAVAV
jgi:hypothetical protein